LRLVLLLPMLASVCFVLDFFNPIDIFFIYLFLTKDFVVFILMQASK
jgi:hypothetical protein